MPSISFRKSSKMTSINHNNRKLEPKNFDPDREKDNIYFSIDIKDLYHQIFDEAVKDYNENQPRKDRKIKNYYEKVSHSKKQREQQELIIQIGTMFDSQNATTKDDFEEILIDYVNEWAKRNPHLPLFNAALHQDEDGGPHLHLNFVPYADYESGLKRRVNFEKALKQQGCEDFGKWREKETGIIEQMMKERGYTREYVGTHEYVKPDIYKQIAREIGQNYEKEIKLLKSENVELTDQLERVRFQRNSAIEEITRYKTEFQSKLEEEINKVKAEFKEALEFFKWGRTKKTIWEKYEDFKFRQLMNKSVFVRNKDEELKKIAEKRGLGEAYNRWRQEQQISKKEKNIEWER